MLSGRGSGIRVNYEQREKAPAVGATAEFVVNGRNAGCKCNAGHTCINGLAFPRRLTSLVTPPANQVTGAMRPAVVLRSNGLFFCLDQGPRKRKTPPVRAGLRVGSSRIGYHASSVFSSQSGKEG